jgi:hypothetical protein
MMLNAVWKHSAEAVLIVMKPLVLVVWSELEDSCGVVA